MYGLVNHAIQGLLTKEFGEEKWNEIKEKAGVEVDVFVSMQQYDDAITYNLVSAASEITGVEATVLLEAFGMHWVLYTAEHGYAEMMDSSGDTFYEFVGNLNHLHKRVANILPELAPPSFDVEKTGDNSMILTYSSHRVGLNPMVIGLLKGLAKRFNENEVNVIETSVEKTDKGYVSTFNISW